MDSVMDTSKKTCGRLSLDRSGICLGTSDYDEILKSSVFVDKTMLIKEIVNSKHKVLLITCPRRFGKSTNMDKIKRFLELQIDKNGDQATEIKKTDNYYRFERIINGNKLKIMNEGDFVNKHFAKYPSIFVDF